MRTMVIGVGNPYRRDDAAGIEAVARLGRWVADGALPDLELHQHDGEPAGLLNLWEGAGHVYVVDAVVSGSEPGTVHWTDIDDGVLPPRQIRDSSHALGLADAIELARALGRLPQRLSVVGVEGREFGVGVGTTVAVARAVDLAVEMIVEDIVGGA